MLHRLHERNSHLTCTLVVAAVLPGQPAEFQHFVVGQLAHQPRRVAIALHCCLPAGAVQDRHAATVVPAASEGEDEEVERLLAPAVVAEYSIGNPADDAAAQQIWIPRECPEAMPDHSLLPAEPSHVDVPLVSGVEAVLDDRRLDAALVLEPLELVQRHIRDADVPDLAARYELLEGAVGLELVRMPLQRRV